MQIEESSFLHSLCTEYGNIGSVVLPIEFLVTHTEDCSGKVLNNVMQGRLYALWDCGKITSKDNQDI